MAVQTQIQTRRGTAASWTSTNPTLAAGEFGYETDTGKFKIGNGSTAWASLAYTAASTAVTYLFNATSGQTTFSGADANGLTLAYTVGAEQVYLNGVLQVRGSDYTATNGTSIVLTSGALTSDVLNVIAYSAMTITDTYTQAQADAKFFQTANAFLAGKNKIINGDFSIWQRGTTGLGTGGGFNADRWMMYADGSGVTNTVSQQTFTAGAAPVSGYEGQYYFQYQCTVAGTGGTERSLYTRLEDVRTFAGQTVTLSFWAKADAARTISGFIRQNFGSGGSANVDTSFTSQSATTSWARYSATITLPSISGKTIGSSSFLQVTLQFPTNVTETIQIWGVQLEAGSIATPFQTATGTLAGELAACQRYYYRTLIEAAPTRAGVGYNNTTTTANIALPFPVAMRTRPTALEQSGTATDYSIISAGTTVTACSSVPTFDTANTYQGTFIFTVASGLTAGQSVFGRLATTNGYLGWSAEL